VSRQLFASRFTIPHLAAGEEAPFSYDEKRSLNVRPDGSPVVEHGDVTTMGTITKVRAEASDRDSAEALVTITKASGEASDRAETTATQTRVKGEYADHLEDQASAHYGEAPAAVLLGTHTAGPGEPTDPPHARRPWPTTGPGAASVRRVVH
jgi:hypothetical protein